MHSKGKCFICVLLVLALLVCVSPASFAVCYGAYEEVPNFPQVQNGLYGNTVKVVQRFLCRYKNGWAASIALAGGVDGYFGYTTKFYVKAFQEDRGLEQDGVVGHDTWTHIRYFTYESTTQYPSQATQNHFGDNLTNYYCYYHNYNIWKFRHLSEGIIHFFDNGGNSLPDDEFHYCYAYIYDFDDGYI